MTIYIFNFFTQLKAIQLWHYNNVIFRSDNFPVGQILSIKLPPHFIFYCVPIGTRLHIDANKIHLNYCHYQQGHRSFYKCFFYSYNNHKVFIITSFDSVCLDLSISSMCVEAGILSLTINDCHECANFSSSLEH